MFVQLCFLPLGSTAGRDAAARGPPALPARAAGALAQGEGSAVGSRPGSYTWLYRREGEEFGLHLLLHCFSNESELRPERGVAVGGAPPRPQQPGCNNSTVIPTLPSPEIHSHCPWELYKIQIGYVVSCLKSCTGFPSQLKENSAPVREPRIWPPAPLLSPPPLRSGRLPHEEEAGSGGCRRRRRPDREAAAGGGRTGRLPQEIRPDREAAAGEEAGPGGCRRRRRLDRALGTYASIGCSLSSCVPLLTCPESLLYALRPN